MSIKRLVPSTSLVPIGASPPVPAKKKLKDKRREGSPADWLDATSMATTSRQESVAVDGTAEGKPSSSARPDHGVIPVIGPVPLQDQTEGRRPDHGAMPVTGPIPLDDCRGQSPEMDERASSVNSKTPSQVAVIRAEAELAHARLMAAQANLELAKAQCTSSQKSTLSQQLSSVMNSSTQPGASSSRAMVAPTPIQSLTDQAKASHDLSHPPLMTVEEHFSRPETQEAVGKPTSGVDKNADGFCRGKTLEQGPNSEPKEHNPDQDIANAAQQAERFGYAQGVRDEKREAELKTTRLAQAMGAHFAPTVPYIVTYVSLVVVPLSPRWLSCRPLCSRHCVVRPWHKPT